MVKWCTQDLLKKYMKIPKHRQPLVDETFSLGCSCYNCKDCKHFENVSLYNCPCDDCGGKRFEPKEE